MKLELSQKFTLEIPQNDGYKTIDGTIRPLSKKELKDFKESMKPHIDKANELQKKSITLQRLEAKIKRAERNDGLSDNEFDSLYKDMDDLREEVMKQSEELEGLDTEEVAAKKRFEMSVKSDDIEELISICNQVGYSAVIQTINKDVEQGKLKDTKS